MKDCHWHIDSFHVTFEHISANLGPDTFICEGQAKVLDVTAPGAAYQWQDGSTDATYTASRAGTYHVKITRNGCTAADTIVLEEVTPRLSILEPDTMLCLGTQITLHALATPASQLLWSNGSTEDHILTNGPGKYKVTATSVCGILSDEVNIEEATCNCERPFVPNAFSPNNDNKNESFRVYINCPGINGFYFAIYNRFGQRIFESRNIDQGWDGLHNGQKADLGVYFYRLVCKTPEGKEIKKKGDITLLR